MALHWGNLQWVICVAIGAGTWRYMPLAVVRLVITFTHNKQRVCQCLEILRLARRDAPSIDSYLGKDVK